MTDSEFALEQWGGSVKPVPAPPNFVMGQDEDGLPRVLEVQTTDPIVVGGETFATRWHYENQVQNLQRNLEGIEHRLAHVEEAVAPWDDPPLEEEVARRRESLEGEKAFVLSELERLGHPANDPKKGKRRR